MPYLIDGHNVIAYLRDIELDDPNDEMMLVAKLRGFCAVQRKRCTVIFDSGLPGGRSPASNNAVEVIFASYQHATADELLVGRIKKMRDAPNWVVVTSDNAILSIAQLQGCKVLRSDAFAKKLNTPSRPKPEAGEWTNPMISPQDLAEWQAHFSETQLPPPTDTPPPASPIAVESRTLPKPKPKPPKPPKPPRPNANDEEINSVAYWLRLFGEDSSN